MLFTHNYTYFKAELSEAEKKAKKKAKKAASKVEEKKSLPRTLAHFESDVDTKYSTTTTTKHK